MLEDVLTAVGSDAATIPSWQVILLGLGIVFLGLICIIALIKVMSWVISLFTKNAKKANVQTNAGNAASNSSVAMPDDQTIVAIAACLAEEMGTDVKALRIKSIKRI